MGQIADHYAYQHQLPPIAAYVFDHEPAESALPQAEFSRRGWLMHGQQHRDLTVGLDTANSRLVRSGMLQASSHSWFPKRRLVYHPTTAPWLLPQTGIYTFTDKPAAANDLTVADLRATD
jgi:hypothetical protein